MKKLYTLALFIFSITARSQSFCATSEMHEKWFASHPELRAAFEASHEKALADNRLKSTRRMAQGAQAAALGTPVFTIPVVFHILHTGGTENISDAQVIDAVNILTRDYNKMNADTSLADPSFQSIIGDVKVKFVLATKDPNGNCTNGIIRHWDTNTNWTGAFTDYTYTWPHNKYLNIYSVKDINIGQNAAAYTFLPGSGVPPAADCIVSMSHYIGSIGTGMQFRSRVLTHEVGHWLGLEHTWGWGQVSTSCGDDGIFDTPLTQGFTSCSLSNAVICNPPVVENVQNYMDYSYCNVMFTADQANLMQGTLMSTIEGRDNLSDPVNLAQTGVTNPGVGCQPYLDISPFPVMTACSGQTVTIKSYTWNANPTSYLWTADNGATVINATQSICAIALNNIGPVTVSCVVSNGNGTSSQFMTINTLDGLANISGAYKESFETSGSSMPPGWLVINNGTPNEKWEMTGTAASHAQKSMYLKGEDLAPGSEEILETPSYDLKSNPGAMFSFKYAYARSSTSHMDVFKVLASTDCGGTWKEIYFPGISVFAQASGGVQQMPFTPLVWDWSLYVLSSHPNYASLTSQSNVRFRFYFKEDENALQPGNRLYLDEINLSLPTGVNDFTRYIGLNVYPNPAKSQFNVAFTLSSASEVEYTLASVTGAVLLQKNEGTLQPGEQNFSLNDTGSLSPGVYLLTLSVDGVKACRKIVVE